MAIQMQQMRPSHSTTGQREEVATIGSRLCSVVLHRRPSSSDTRSGLSTAQAEPGFFFRRTL